MGVRQFIQGYPKAGAFAAGSIILVALFLLFNEARSMGSGGGQNQYYYSTDDGKSYFSDAMSKMPPYEVSGVMAVRAHVYQVNGTPTVVYLSRYSQRSLDALKEAMEARSANRAPAHPEILAAMGTSGTEIKRPGESAWFSTNSVKAMPIMKTVANLHELEP